MDLIISNLKWSSDYCRRAPCIGRRARDGCVCGKAEGHPELATLVEAERQRREIELLHREDAKRRRLCSSAETPP